MTPDRPTSLSPLPLERLAAQLVIPVLDLRAGRDLDATWAEAEALRDLGVGGFILFGGEREALAERLPRFKAAAGERPPLIGADLERGAGQQVVGCGHLPPLMALGAADDVELAREAGAAVAREALGVGIDWIFAPVLDLADEPLNPIVSGRAFAADPERVTALGAAFVEGVEQAGALACAKHFPGHGGTQGDSHDSLPGVERAAEVLRARDLLPFRRAVLAGVSSVMTAHIRVPALGAAHGPATLSRRVVTDLLRGELGFRGLVVSDALIMEGARVAGERALTEAEAGVAAFAAGCDLLLYPDDPRALIAALVAWAAEEGADGARRERLRESVDRLAQARTQLARAAALERGAEARDAARRATAALEVAIVRRALTRLGARRPALRPGDRARLVVLDDDEVPGLGHELCSALVEGGVELDLDLERPERAAAAQGAPTPTTASTTAVGGSSRTIALVGCQVRAWKGRRGLAPERAAALRALPGAGTTVVALCGPYALEGAVPPGAEVLLAWGDAASAQAAAAEALLGGEAPGRAPVPADVFAAGTAESGQPRGPGAGSA